MKQKLALKWIDQAAEWLIRHLPDWITGSSAIMNKKYRIRYGDVDYITYIHEKKIRIMKIYIIICCIFVIFGLISIAGQSKDNKEITEIQRPGFGQTMDSFPMRVQVMYEDYSITKDVIIKAAARELNKTEKEKQLRSYQNKLETIILGQNKDLKHVSAPLNLIDGDEETGIAINWTSENPQLITENGEVNLIAAEDNQQVELMAELNLDDVSLTVDYQIKLDTNASKEDYQQNLSRTLEGTLEKINEPDTSMNIALPQQLDHGVRIKWLNGRDNNIILIIFSFLFAILIVFLKRYDQINKEIKEAEESISKDLPEFINKLVLLLNAGLVVSTAFSKIVDDHEAYHHAESKSDKNNRFLYSELYEIQKKVNQSNASLIRELKDFSRRSGSRELVRITAVISDNWNKGSMLAEKLEGESNMLWNNRKKRAEEKGKISETKLTFPLMILLIVLIMITIAPAMMEM